jgi:hypothetical protein
MLPLLRLRYLRFAIKEMVKINPKAAMEIEEACWRFRLSEDAGRVRSTTNRQTNHAEP